MTRDLAAAECRLLGHRDQALALRSLARGLPAPANGLALLARSALGRLFISAPALDLAEETFALQFLLQDPQGLFDIVFADKDFQSWLRSIDRCTFPSMPLATMRRLRLTSSKAERSNAVGFPGQALTRGRCTGSN
jgi:hypothetical protein